MLALWRKIAARRLIIHSARLIATAIVILVASRAEAQAASGIGDEARAIPGGDIRLSVSEADTRWNQRYGPGGVLPFGADLSVDSLNVAQLPILTASQSALRSLLGNPAYRLTLGNTVVRSAERMSSTPITLELGVTHWLTLRASAPIVRTHDEVFFNPNAARSGNVGLNPALAAGSPARATNAAFVAQLAQAGSTLQADLAACQGNPASATYCPSLNAQAAAATALIQQSSAFANAVTAVYGGASGTPALVVPIAGSAEQRQVSTRVTTLSATYAHFDSLTGGPGITGPGPVPAAPLAYNDAQTLLTQPPFGLLADSLHSIDRVGLGDMDLSATLELFDSFHGNDSARVHPHGFNVRTAVTGVYRLGTGLVKSPDDYVGIGAATGTGTNAIEVRSATDLLFGPHFWTSVIVRATKPMSDQIAARIPLGLTNVYVPAFATQLVGRTLGRSLEIEVDPHLTVTNYFCLTLNYLYRHKELDTYTGRFSFDSATTGFGPVTLDAGILGVGTNWTEQRVGLGLTYSTVSAVVRGKASIPLDISFFHYQTADGSGNQLPRLSHDEVQLRLYMRLFGHKLRPGT